MASSLRIADSQAAPTVAALPARTVHARDVLMLAPTMFFADYGSHVRILEEAISLRALEHRLRILAYPNGNDVAGLSVRRCPGVPFNYRIIVGSSRHRIYLDALLALTSLHEVLVRPPELIHAHLHEGALIGSVLGGLRRRPVLFDFQGSLTAEMLDHGFLRPGGKRQRFWHELERVINRLPSAIITSSTHAADLVIREFGVSRERVFPVLDSVNTTTFRPRAAEDDADLQSLRQQLAIPPERTLVVYLGLLAEHQGTGLLLHAAQALLAGRDDLHFLIMGFPNEQHYLDLARDLGILSHTTFTGRLPYEQAARHLRLGDVAVAPKMSSYRGLRQTAQLHGRRVAHRSLPHPHQPRVPGPLGELRRAHECPCLCRGPRYPPGQPARVARHRPCPARARPCPLLVGGSRPPDQRCV